MCEETHRPPEEERDRITKATLALIGITLQERITASKEIPIKLMKLLAAIGRGGRVH